MGKLKSYLRRVQISLQKASEVDARDLDNTEAVDLVSDTTLALLRLSSGCPKDLRIRIRTALLTAAVTKVAEILDEPEGEQEQEQESAEEGPADGEEGEAAVDVEVGDEAAEPGVLDGVVAKLWDLEQPTRLVMGSDIVLEDGARAASLESGQDLCEAPLFKQVDEEKLMTPITKAFIGLLDNYSRDSSSAEVVTDDEEQEMNTFLSLLAKTPQFLYVHRVLVSWGKADESMDEFLGSVYTAWFSAFRCGKRGPISTSGFEHVFVGEEKYDRRRKKHMISGLHNWIQFYMQEKMGKVDYLGFVGQTEEDDLVISARFLWDDEDPDVEAKSVSTFLVGTSVAFDFSLATLSYFGLEGGDDCSTKVEIGGHKMKIQVYKYESKLGMHARTVYLEG